MPADLEAAGIDALWLPELPTVVQLFLALSLKGTTEEFARGVIHNAEIYLVAPGPTAAVAVSFEFSDVAPPGHDPAWEVPSFHRLVLDFEVTDYGPHLVEVYVNGANLAFVPLVVRQP